MLDRCLLLFLPFVMFDSRVGSAEFVPFDFLSGGTGSIASGVNADGSAVVGQSDSPLGMKPFAV